MFKQVFVVNSTMEYYTNVDFNCRLCGIEDAKIYYRVAGDGLYDREYECEGCHKNDR